MVVGKSPLLSGSLEGARALHVEQGWLMGAGLADGEQERGRTWNVGQHGRGCRMHLLPHASVSGLYKGAQNHYIKATQAPLATGADVCKCCVLLELFTSL